MLIEWLQKCDNLRGLDFNPDEIIKTDLKNVKKFLPLSRKKLIQQRPELYSILKARNITT